MSLMNFSRNIPEMLVQILFSVLIFIFCFALSLEYCLDPITVTIKSNFASLDKFTPLKHLDQIDNYLISSKGLNVKNNRIAARINEISYSQFEILSQNITGDIEQASGSYDVRIFKPSVVTKIYLLMPNTVRPTEIDVIIGSRLYKNINDDKIKPISFYNDKFSHLIQRTDIDILEIIPYQEKHSNLILASRIINWKGDIYFFLGILVSLVITFISYILLKTIRSELLKKDARNDGELEITRLHKILGLLAVFVPVIVYNIIILKNYFPITEGWWSYVGSLILDGKQPYKDFYLYIPPVYPYLIAFFIKIFGIEIIKLRIFGLLLQVLTAVVLYNCLRKLFNPLIASISTAFSMFVFLTSFTAFSAYDYNQLASFMALLIVYILIKYDDIPEYYSRSGLIAGFLSVILLFTKQSTGFIVFVSVLWGLIITNCIDDAKKKLLFSYLLSVFSGILIFIIALRFNDSLGKFFDNVIIGASVSKGGGTAYSVLYNWFPRIFRGNMKFTLNALVVTILLLLCFIKTSNRFYIRLNNKNTRFALILFCVMSTIAVLLPYSYSGISQHISFSYYYKFINKTIENISIIVIFPLMILLMMRLYRSAPFILMVCLSFAMLMNTALSNAVVPYGTMPAIALLVGLLLKQQKNLFFMMIFICLVSIYILAGVSSKYKTPYSWGGYKCDDLRKTVIFKKDIKVINGLGINSNMKELLNMLSNAKYFSSKTAFCYPNMPVFYLITNTKSITFAPFHWYDVANDDVSKMDAVSILTNNPDFIIWNKNVDNYDMKQHEALFRNGKQCGQRNITSVLEKLTEKEKKYKLLNEIWLDESNVFQIWERIIIKSKTGVKANAI